MFALLIVAVLLFILIKGITVKETISKLGCTATYDNYVVDNLGHRLDPAYNFGWWDSTEENKNDAIITVGFCLCKKYTSQPSDNLAKTIKDWCNQLPNCGDQFTNNITKFCRDNQLWISTLGGRM